MPKMTATEVARNFSDVLNRVTAGEEIEISRNGSVVALLRPARSYFLSPERFKALVESLPPADEDFARDLREIRKSVGPPRDPWAS